MGPIQSRRHTLLLRMPAERAVLPPIMMPPRHRKLPENRESLRREKTEGAIRKNSTASGTAIQRFAQKPSAQP